MALVHCTGIDPVGGAVCHIVNISCYRLLCPHGCRISKIRQPVAHTQASDDDDNNQRIGLLSTSESTTYNSIVVVGDCGCEMKPIERIPSGIDLADKCWHTHCIDFPVCGSKEITRTRDFYELVRDPNLFDDFITLFALAVRRQYPNIDVIVSPDTHGFMFGLLTAQKLHKPFVPVRKLRKLPGKTIGVEYSARDGKKENMWIQNSDTLLSKKVLVIDEKLASGCSLMAAFKLIQDVKAEVSGCFVVYEDVTFNGRDAVLSKFPDIHVTSLLMTATPPDQPNDSHDGCSTCRSSPERDNSSGRAEEGHIGINIGDA